MNIPQLHARFCQVFLGYQGYERERDHFVFRFPEAHMTMPSLLRVEVEQDGEVPLAGLSYPFILIPLIYGALETSEFFISKKECELFGILTRAYQQVTATYNRNQTRFKVWPGCTPMAHIEFTLSKGNYVTTTHPAAVELLHRYHIQASVALKRARTLTVGGSNG